MSNQKYIATSEANCQHCYKCLRNCFVKTIKFERSKSVVLEDNCILCGNCIEICPQQAKNYIKETHKFENLVNKPFLVSIAPSFFANYDEPLKIITLLKNLGAVVVQETAIGADLVSEKYKEWFNQTGKTLITTACPVVVSFAEICYPETLEYFAPFLSPMNAHATYLKEHFGPLPIVFIGPCIAKKREALGYIDLVLTFEEFNEFITKNQFDYGQLDESLPTPPHPSKGRSYPISGGVNFTISSDPINYLTVEGLDNLDRILKNINLHDKKFFIESSACFGSCIAGLGTRKDLSHLEKRERLLKVLDKIRLANENVFNPISVKLDLSKKFNPFVEERVYEEKDIQEVLVSTGKLTPRDELNCGACGYNSCREKAIAVLANRAEKEMCLPYMMKKATSLSNIIVEKFPHIVVIYDEKGRLMYLNPSAEQMFYGEEDVLSDIVLRVENKEVSSNIEVSIKNKKYIFFYKNFLIPEENSKVLMLIDITKEQQHDEQIKALEKQAAEKIEEVINKQMRLAQEIAGILGESVAETKSSFQEFKSFLEKDNVNL